MFSRFRVPASVGLVLAFMVAVPLPSEAMAHPSGVIINEVDADQVSTDSAEFVELFDGGSGGTDLSGLSIVLYNGSDDASYLAFDLDGLSTDSNGYFVLCGNASNVSNCDLDVSPNTNLIQNGADAVALVEGDAAAYPNDTAVSDVGLIDAIVYDTNDNDDGGLLVLLNAGQPQVNEGGGGNQITESNQRCDNGAGGERNTDTYTQAAPSPGEANTCSVNPPAPIAALIHEVQGSGNASPLAGQVVTIEGIVVGDFQNTDLNGFFVQEEDSDADADAATSEGVFIFQGASSVEVQMGDTVRVTGQVTEFFDLTEINNISEVQIISTGTSNLATAALLSFPVSSTDFEHLEGMAIRISQTMVISEYFNFDRFGEIALTTGRLPQPTSIFDPGSVAAAAQADLNARSRITLDDGWTAQNVDPARHPNGSEFTLANRFRGGDLLSNITGVMHDSFGYRIHPTAGADYTSANQRPTSPQLLGGDITVASFNVLNYFTTLDGAGSICGPLQNLGCRGADNASEFVRQRDKIVSAIAEINADIVGLIEIENHPGDAAVLDLVNSINNVMGPGTYASVATGIVGDDAIKVAFIYKPGSVSLEGAHAVLDTQAFLDPNNTGSARNRAALAQTFTEVATGESLTVAVNHLKSKGSQCGSGDDDAEAGSCNLTRTLGAIELATWLGGDPTSSGDEDVLIIGDLNSYDKEDPIDALVAAGYRDLIADGLGEDAYSYVFSGQWGYLDYAMANEALSAAVVGTTIWHINSDEPDILDYDTSFKKPAQDALYETNAFRSSDHDPVIVGLNLANPRGAKQTVIADLEALLPSGDRLTDKRLTKAIDAVESSLAPSRWIDGQTINTKKVFDDERKAMAQLLLVLNSSASAAPMAGDAIEMLLNADRQLAQLEILAAIEQGGSANKITSATAAYNQGVAFWESGQILAATNSFKSAWDAAHKA